MPGRGGCHSAASTGTSSPGPCFIGLRVELLTRTGRPRVSRHRAFFVGHDFLVAVLTSLFCLGMVTGLRKQIWHQHPKPYPIYSYPKPSSKPLDPEPLYTPLRLEHLRDTSSMFLLHLLQREEAIKVCNGNRMKLRDFECAPCFRHDSPALAACGPPSFATRISASLPSTTNPKP